MQLVPNTSQRLAVAAPARAPANKTAKKRMTISLSGEIAEILIVLAERQNITQNEALCRAIATEDFFFEEREKGAKVLIRRPEQKELVEVEFLR